jgi:hypothetical protein
MKKLLASAMLAFCFLGTPVMATENCPPGAHIDHFFSVIEQTNGRVKAFELTPTGSAKALALINTRLAANNIATIKVDRFVIVVTTGSPRIGVLQFYDGCVVSGAGKGNINLTFEELVTFLHDAGVKDEEVIEVKGV